MHDRELGAGLHDAHGVRQLLGEALVDLDGDDGCPGLEQSEGQRAEPRADLEHGLARLDARGLHDAPHGVGVVHEVLPELLRRRDVEQLGEVADLGRPEQARRRVAAALGRMPCAFTPRPARQSPARASSCHDP